MLSQKSLHEYAISLAYVFGKRKDIVFYKLKAWLDPMGVHRYYKDVIGGRGYKRHLEMKLASGIRRKPRVNILIYALGLND